MMLRMAIKQRDALRQRKVIKKRWWTSEPAKRKQRYLITKSSDTEIGQTLNRTMDQENSSKSSRMVLSILLLKAMKKKSTTMSHWWNNQCNSRAGLNQFATRVIIMRLLTANSRTSYKAWMNQHKWWSVSHLAPLKWKFIRWTKNRGENSLKLSLLAWEHAGTESNVMT